MKTHIVIDGNAFYEIDEECLKQKKEKKERQLQKRQRKQADGKTQQNHRK